MKIGAAKLVATVVCSASVLGFSAAPADACCFLNWLFGPCCGSGCAPAPAYYGPSPCGPAGCAPTYGGCSSGNCGTAYYSPYVWSGSSSCDGCSVGGSSGCASGDCGVNSTYAPGQSTPPVHEDWRTKKSNGEGTGPAPATNGSGAAEDRTKSETDLEKKVMRYRAPADSTFGHAGGAAPGTTDAIPIQPRKSLSAPVATPIPEDEDKDSDKLPILNYDEKVAWRSAPERKRLTTKPQVGNARLIRLPAYPKSEWTPVDSDAKVAKK